ncbi:TBC1 domain family member 24-like [Latimeria chalumnae]|uniref:TBC1 domain family member 24-like n=1 Tax=Latimeria chalumnae TaxID=7897 RepID=UPI0006D90207|nr:PREDICTED: TBC1 domain family member 24-like isoform X1 [Latimeria chalumnae]|eukprot:XP_014340138.1 PREDICTED: TBC1 domain family member 24-like isoform X1 [Latimeria chalumnae]
MLIFSDTENWEIDTLSCTECMQFVDWDKMPRQDTASKSSKDVLPQDFKGLKMMAREGYWANSYELRTQAYNQIIKNIQCRIVTPDAGVYRDIVGRMFGKQSISAHPLPEFVEDSLMPVYYLSTEGTIAVKKILVCIADQFPDITYCPDLPAIVALLLHYSEDDAECFESICKLINCNDTKKSYIDQTFLSYKASCMTFGDLANKYCPAAHRLIATTSQDVFDIYSEWLIWIFGDLPFLYAICILDVFLLEGYKVLYRIGLALLKQYRASVASKESKILNIQQDIRNFMRNISEHITVAQLLEKAFRIRLLSRKQIHLLQLANKTALTQKGITRIQRRFYLQSEGHEPTVLLLKTIDGEVCGAFLSSDWNERKKRNGKGSQFFGTGECLVFTVRPEMERYEWVMVKSPELAKATCPLPRSRSPSPVPTHFSTSRRRSLTNQSSSFLTVPFPTSADRYSPFLSLSHFELPSKTASMFMSGDNEAIIIGGGGGQALHIDADIHHGRTQHCDTFDNPPLCQETFQIQELEVWGFQTSLS